LREFYNALRAKLEPDSEELLPTSGAKANEPRKQPREAELTALIRNKATAGALAFKNEPRRELKMATPYRDPQRGPYVGDRKNNTMAWTLGALAALFMLGLFFFMGSDTRTARTNDPATTGQNTRAPVPNAGTTQDNVNSPVNAPTR
jgi:hypothetical protein